MDNRLSGKFRLISGNVPPLVLITAGALVILLWNLGMSALWGSEGRWAVIGRYMYQTGDLLNPMIGVAPYWDKPIVSYWQILPGAFVLGQVDEFSARIPSVLWAVAMLFLTFDLARKWFGRQSALMAAAILSTSYAFVFWGRNAQVEMTNAAVILLAVWYFIARKDSGSDSWLYILAFILGIGTNMKGLTAVGVPVFCMLALSLVNRDWKWFPSYRGLIISALIFFIAFLTIPLAGCFASSSWDPIALVWKENVVRFFEPFDHKGPVYTYLISIFSLMAPWSLFIPPAVYFYLRSGRFRDKGILDALIIFCAIFMFFTASGSRRSYYLLPIIPFAAILIGELLFRFVHDDLSSGVSSTIRYLGFILGTVFLLPVVCVMIKPWLIPVIENQIRPLTIPEGIEVFFPWTLLSLGLGVFIISGFLRRSAPVMIIPIIITWMFYIAVYIPWADKMPGNVRTDTARIAAMNKPVGFLLMDDSKVVFYLNRPYEIIGGLDQAKDWARRTGGVLITMDDIRDPAWKTLVANKNWQAYLFQGI